MSASAHSQWYPSSHVSVHGWDQCNITLISSVIFILLFQGVAQCLHWGQGPARKLALSRLPWLRWYAYGGYIKRSHHNCLHPSSVMPMLSIRTLRPPLLIACYCVARLLSQPSPSYPSWHPERCQEVLIVAVPTNVRGGWRKSLLKCAPPTKKVFSQFHRRLSPV